MSDSAFTLYLFGSSVAWGFPYAPTCDIGTIVSQMWSGSVNGAELALRNEAQYGAPSRHVLERARSVARRTHSHVSAIALVYSGNNEFLHLSPGPGARGRGPALADAAERRAIATSHYENIEAGILELRRAGIEVVLSTIPVNLRDWPPSYSVLDADQAEQVESLYRSTQATGDTEELLREVFRTDPEIAQARFMLGRALLAAGRATDALPHFVAANDFDGRPIRATTAINHNIRMLATEHGVRLLDAEASFAAAAPDGVCGNAQFWDDCHPTLDGYIRLASGLSVHIADMAGVGAPPPPPTPEDVRRVHSIDDEFVASVYGRMGLYCYKHSDCWDSDRTLNLAADYLSRALRMSPTNVEVHIALALVLARRGDEAGARRHARAALELVPDRALWLLHGREARAGLGALGITDVERWARGEPA